MTISRRTMRLSSVLIAVLILGVVFSRSLSDESEATVESIAMESSTPDITAPTGSSEPKPSSVIASREGAQGFSQLRADLRSVHRSGRLVRVDFSVTTVASGLLGWSPSDRFGSAPTEEHTGPDDLSGLTMTDPINAKLYPPVADQQGKCVCTRSLVATNLDEDRTMDFFATFGAPPADVTHVDINVPMFGTFSNVALG